MSVIQDPIAFDCTPSSLLASVPCLSCLSETEMLAGMVGIGSLLTGKTIAQIMSASACNTCMSKKQMLQALLTIMGNDLIAEQFSEAETLDAMRCTRGCSNQKQLLAALLYLLCNDIKFSARNLRVL